MSIVEHIDSQRRRLKSGFQSKCISWELDNKVSPPRLILALTLR